MFGYDAAEVIGQNVKILMASPYQEEHDQYLTNYLTTGIKKVIGIGREVPGTSQEWDVLPCATVRERSTRQ